MSSIASVETRVSPGERFEIVEDIAVDGHSTWRAPFTGRFVCVIPAGTVVVAGACPAPERFAAVPEDYEQMESRLVPRRFRESDKYVNYYFWFRSDDIETRLRPLPRCA